MEKEKYVIEIKDLETTDLETALGINYEDLVNRIGTIAEAYAEDTDEFVKGKCRFAELIRSVSLACKTKEELAFMCFSMGRTSAEEDIKLSFKKTAEMFENLFEEDDLDF